MAVCQAKMPSCVYAGEGCIAKVKDVLFKENAKSVLVFTDRGIEATGLLTLLTDELAEAGFHTADEVPENTDQVSLTREMMELFKNGYRPYGSADEA